MNKPLKPTSLDSSVLASDESYKTLLTEIKSRLKKAQLRAAVVVNNELIQFYWSIGKLILEKQQQAKWGDKLFVDLAKDLAHSFPDTQGFSKTNLKNMKLFAQSYPEAEFGQALPDQLTWTHHIVLIQQVNNKDERPWYALKTVENGWSYRDLAAQIKSGLYARQAHGQLKTTNFHEKLASPNSNLAHEMIKDPYKFHFLTIGKDAHEREIHQGLISHCKEFLMELGQGFALYGTHYPIHVSNKRFEIDLLFYNTKLHAYIVCELKRGDFKPEHAGQLNFYLSAVDEQLKMPEDNPTIGLLLCENKDRIIAEYSLRNVDSPMGIAEFKLSKSLPKKLHNILPTTDEIETELTEFSKEILEKKSATQSRKSKS